MAATRKQRGAGEAKRLLLSGALEDTERARSFVRSELGAGLPGGVVDDVELLAGELAAQAGRDRGSAGELRLDTSSDRVRVELAYSESADASAPGRGDGPGQGSIRLPAGLACEWEVAVAPADRFCLELDLQRFAAEPARRLQAGDSVEVRVGYTGDWSAGFEIAATVEGGFQVRRTNDGYLLPAPTSRTDIRAAH